MYLVRFFFFFVFFFFSLFFHFFFTFFFFFLVFSVFRVLGQKLWSRRSRRIIDEKPWFFVVKSCKNHVYIHFITQVLLWSTFPCHPASFLRNQKNGLGGVTNSKLIDPIHITAVNPGSEKLFWVVLNTYTPLNDLWNSLSVAALKIFDRNPIFAWKMIPFWKVRNKIKKLPGTLIPKSCLEMSWTRYTTHTTIGRHFPTTHSSFLTKTCKKTPFFALPRPKSIGNKSFRDNLCKQPNVGCLL